MAITLTSTAAERVRKFIDAKAATVGLRVSIRTTGCSGFAYVVNLAETVAHDDHVYETEGVQVLVDPKSLPYIDGTEIDYARKGLTEGFQFDTPNVKGECGCGESFAV